MNSAIERLLSLKVSDVARSDVVAVSAHAAMSEAAHTLTAHDISGAPVVDEQGRLVGVLSAFDFARRARSSDAPKIATAESVSSRLRADDGDRPLEIEPLPHDMVERFMTTAVQTVTPKTSLLDAARVMCGAHVHRVVVVDADGRPAGLLTSLDVVAAVVQAVEE